MDDTEEDLVMTPPHLSTEGDDRENRDSTLRLSHLHITRTDALSITDRKKITYMEWYLRKVAAHRLRKKLISNVKNEIKQEITIEK